MHQSCSTCAFYSKGADWHCGRHSTVELRVMGVVVDATTDFDETCCDDWEEPP